jgi:hypothetical protein
MFSVRPSFRVKQLGSPWMDFYEILYLSLLGMGVEKIQV